VAGRTGLHIGWSNSLGWYEGLPSARGRRSYGRRYGLRLPCRFGHLLVGGLKTFLAVRHQPNPRLSSVGSAAAGPYVTDKGFEGAENCGRWLDLYGVRIIHPPKRNSGKRSSGPSA
jgi:hypothetical protein